jgi:hypothetical protein
MNTTQPQGTTTTADTSSDAAIPMRFEATTLPVRAYPSEEAAHQAVETLRAAGVPPRRIRLLTSRPLRDGRRELRGGFAGPVAPHAPVGTFAGPVHRRNLHIGSFATGSFTGDPGRQREGSFGDADRVVIATHDGAGGRSRVTGRAGVRRLLRRAALDDDAVELALTELEIGHAVVLVDAAGIAPGEGEARLEQVAQAA